MRTLALARGRGSLWDEAIEIGRRVFAEGLRDRALSGENIGRSACTADQVWGGEARVPPG
ncbi:MAG: hypothetical protein U9N46_05385 [Euryarchaeota archaeon]|nr:hypothetical protein [Euryarchaeota archaeon]